MDSEPPGQAGRAPEDDIFVNIIIVGCGRVGAELARLMCLDGATVTVIDQNADAFARLDDHITVQTILGDGTDMETLKRAGIEEADGFAAVTNGDNRNIMAAQIAQRIFKIEHVVCRIYDPLRQRTYKALGLHSISPTVIGAKLLRDTLKGVTGHLVAPAGAVAGAPQGAAEQPTPGVAGSGAAPRS
jgi:trk system potassium uptake protein TrkA